MTQVHMTELLSKTIGECHSSFNESSLFAEKDNEMQKQLFSQIQNKFYNISRIFDCISCDKCRLNGKVQITGLGTALKILYQNQRDVAKNLKKTEIIALVNLMNRLSESLTYYKIFLGMEKDLKFQTNIYKHIGSYISVVAIFIMVKALELLVGQKPVAPEDKQAAQKNKKKERGDKID